MKIPVGIATHKRGDTWDGMRLTAKTKDEFGVLVPVNLTGVSILSQFKTGIDKPFTFEFKTLDGTISVLDAINGIFTFNPRKMDYPTGTYYFDVQLIYQDLEVETIVPTHSWTLSQDISN